MGGLYNISQRGKSGLSFLKGSGNGGNGDYSKGGASGVAFLRGVRLGKNRKSLHGLSMEGIRNPVLCERVGGWATTGNSRVPHTGGT